MICIHASTVLKKAVGTAPSTHSLLLNKIKDIVSSNTASENIHCLTVEIYFAWFPSISDSALWKRNMAETTLIRFFGEDTCTVLDFLQLNSALSQRSHSLWCWLQVTNLNMQHYIHVSYCIYAYIYSHTLCMDIPCKRDITDNKLKTKNLHLHCVT